MIALEDKYLAYAAVDKDGKVFAYEVKPVLSEARGQWLIADREAWGAIHLGERKQVEGQKDWTTTLIKLPEDEQTKMEVLEAIEEALTYD